MAPDCGWIVRRRFCQRPNRINAGRNVRRSSRPTIVDPGWRSLLVVDLRFCPGGVHYHYKFTDRVQYRLVNITGGTVMPAIGRHTLQAAVQGLKQTTGLDAVYRPAPPGQDHFIVEVKAARRAYRFRAEIKTVDRFEIPALIKAQQKNDRELPLLVAPYITREVAERCRQLRLPFLDTAGNTYLEGPGLLVYVVGQPRPHAARRERFRALNSAGLQIVFAFACQPALVQTTYREIARRAGVALGTIGPVMKDLEDRGYLRLQSGGERKLIDPRRMIEEWVTHYPVTLRPKLTPRRFRADEERLRETDLTIQKAYWSGEMAAEKLTGYLKPAQFTIYAREPIAKLVAAAKMRADPAGNVEVLDRFWNFEADKGFPDVVPAVLAYADRLATHDGRDTEAARMIYEQRIAPTFDTATQSD